MGCVSSQQAQGVAEAVPAAVPAGLVVASEKGIEGKESPQATVAAQNVKSLFEGTELVVPGSTGRFWKPTFQESSGRAGRRDWLVQMISIDRPARVLAEHGDGYIDVEVEPEEPDEAPTVYYRFPAFCLRPWNEEIEWGMWLQAGVHVYCAVLEGEDDENSLVRPGKVLNLVHRKGKYFVDIVYNDKPGHFEYYVPVEKVGLEWPFYDPKKNVRK